LVLSTLDVDLFAYHAHDVYSVAYIISYVLLSSLSMTW
jgi:hypothetical protein